MPPRRLQRLAQCASAAVPRRRDRLCGGVMPYEPLTVLVRQKQITLDVQRLHLLEHFGSAGLVRCRGGQWRHFGGQASQLEMRFDVRVHDTGSLELF